MKRFRNFKELFENMLHGEGGILRSGQRFLGVFKKSSILELEKLLNTDLGSSAGRNRRPFIAVFKRGEKYDTYIVVLLSAKNYSNQPVDLSLCNRSNRGLCRGLEIRCYVLRDRKRGEVLAYELRSMTFENLHFDFCGSCTDMEWIENLRRFSVA